MNRIDRLLRTTQHFWRDGRGVAAAEFALIAPLLAMLMLCTADVTFYVRTKLKLDTAASELAQAVTQYQQLYSDDFTTLFSAAQLLAGTVPVSGQFGATIISGITNRAGTPTIAWQQVSGGPGFKSQFGVAGATPRLPAGYVPPIGNSLVVTEVYSDSSLWVLSAGIMGSGSTVVGSNALFEPRLAPLASIIAGNRP